VLPEVIEATKKVLISHGNWDGNLLVNGTLLAIQNMSWGGQLGFQEAPTEGIGLFVTIPHQPGLTRADFVVPIKDQLNFFDLKQGVMGKRHYERGLMWVEVNQAG
jgi:carboxypeptidase D